MSCFSCCGDDDFQRGGDNGAFMTHNPSGKCWDSSVAVA